MTILTLQEFTDHNKIDCTPHTIREISVPAFEREIGVNFGQQLKTYILKYGFLAYSYISFYGINSLRGFHSDMVLTSKSLHNRHLELSNLIAFEDQGDGDYYLVDRNDHVYRFLEECDFFEDTGLDLEEYIVARFLYAKNQKENDI